MRRGLIALGVIAALGVARMPALAAEDATITASDFQFDPSEVTIDAGDTVTFANAGGFHNFTFDDDASAYPAVPSGADDPAWDQPPSRTFAEPGEYTFHCAAHPAQMQGTITVLEAVPTPDPTTDPTPDPTPDTTPDSTPGSTVQPTQSVAGATEPAGAPAAVAVRTLRVTRSTFCVRRSRRCRRPGVRIRIDLSKAARVGGELSRRSSRGRWRRVGRLNLGMVDAGPRTLRFRRAGGRRLKRGRYVLVLRVDGGQPRVLRFRVRG